MATRRRGASGVLIVLAVLLLAGCAARQSDGPPPAGAQLPDTDRLPDAVPRNEPLSAYGNPQQYEVFGRTYRVMDSAEGYVAEGLASWYGTKFHGRRTSSGEEYNMFAMTAAHTTLPLPTYVRVTRLDTGTSVVVRVNDRGPFVDDRLIDLSYAAARRLDMHDDGTARVRVEALPGGTPIRGQDGRPAPAAGGGGEGGELYIQLGAFSRFANAQALRARAAGADIRDVEVERGRDAAGARIYRVRVGPLADDAARRRVLDKLRGAGIEPGHLVHD